MQRLTQLLRHSRGPVLVLRWIYVGFTLADQSQPLLLRCLDVTLEFLGGARQALASVDAQVGLQGRNGSVDPLVSRQHGTITKPLLSNTLWIS